MSYMTGIALGISAGKQFGKLYRRKSKGFSLLHAIPGRRRYHHEKLLNNAEFAGMLANQLTNASVLRSFNINQFTGTVLLEYTCPDEQIDRVMEYLDNLSQRPNPNDAYGKVGSDIRRAASNLNQSVRKNTESIFDLRTLASLGLMVWGANKVWNLGERPSGPQMLWWAYSLMKGRGA